MFWWSAKLFAGFRFSRRVLEPNPVETVGMSVFKFALVFTPCQYAVFAALDIHIPNCLLLAI